MNRRNLNLALAILAIALLAALWLTAHPCDVDGRVDYACLKEQRK